MHTPASSVVTWFARVDIRRRIVDWSSDWPWLANALGDGNGDGSSDRFWFRRYATHGVVYE
mgnify:CR=1 FL=1